MTQLQENCKGVILCGGPSTGTVFRPLSMTLPKPLFPLAGHPMIRHHVEALSKVVSQVFLIGFFEESLFSPLIKQLSVDFPNISVRYLREFQSLGSAGCLFHFRDQILAHGTTSFYVLNADICCSFPLDRLNNLHNEHQQVGTILSMRMDRKFVHKYGCIVPSTGAANKHQVMHFVEKPESFISGISI